MELTKKYLEVTDEAMGFKNAELKATSMTDVQDADEYTLCATLVRDARNEWANVYWTDGSMTSWCRV